MANGKLDLSTDLEFGTLNALEDVNVSNSGDRRRTSSLSALNATTARTYGKDALRRKQRFNGIVVHRRTTTMPRYSDRMGLLETYVASSGTPADTEGSGSTTESDASSGLQQSYQIGGRTIYKVYIPELEPRPAPTGPNDPILNTYPDMFASPGRPDLEKLPIGGVVEVVYEDRNRLFNPQIVEGHKDRFVLLQNFESAQTNQELWDGATASLIGGGECSDGGSGDGGGSGTISLLWPEMEIIQPAVRDILEYIAEHESRGNYNAVNRGVGGDTPGGAKAVVGKDLTAMTIAEVESYMKGGSRAAETGVGGKTTAHPDGSVGVLATGKYQLIPVTLRGAVRSTGIGTSNLYNAENQEVLGVYLLLMKRPVLGRYLLGMTNDVCLAAQHMALEWASIPVQYTYKECGRGYSAYCKGGANATEPLSRSPEEIIQILETARNTIRQNSAAQELIAAKGYKMAPTA